MALQSSGQISIDDIATEFGGTAPHSLNEYYRGGGLVPDTAANAGIPTSGQISLDDFYGGDSVSQLEGQMWLWGRNKYGQLAQNNTTDYFSPVQELTNSTNWITCNAFGGGISAVKSDGRLWSWGFGLGIGDNTTSPKSSPVQTVAGGTNWETACTNHVSTHVVATKSDGRLWCWGNNANGEAGDNTTTNRSSPVQTVTGGTDWTNNIGGSTFSSCAIKTDGRLWSWGQNNLGFLADNTRTPRSSPIQTISGGTNWAKVSNGGTGITAIKTDGRLWNWGANFLGYIGDGSPADTHRSSPVQTIAGGTNWSECSASCGIKTDGRLWNWGGNAQGSIGDNTTSHRSSPVQTVAGGTNWSFVAALENAITRAIKTDGRLWHWGDDAHGALAQGSPGVDRSSPVNNVSGTTWFTCGCPLGLGGESSACAIKT